MRVPQRFSVQFPVLPNTRLSFAFELALVPAPRSIYLNGLNISCSLFWGFIFKDSG